MNRQDYDLLAQVIRNDTLDKPYSSQYRKNISSFVKRLCMELKKDNGRFNEDRFLTACDMDGDSE